jgi:hypothetical protein
MKSKFIQRRYRASKQRACGLCKPQKQGWADKKTFADVRQAVAHEQEVRDWEQSARLIGEDFR